MAANFIKTDFKEAFIIEPRAFEDDRGYFMESYNKEDFKQNGIFDNFIQENYSFSKKNVLRGMHFQKAPHETSKLVQCVEGEIFDVIFDIRKDSPTFGKWQGFYLSKENKKILYVPKGFAHGFCVVSEGAAISYMVDELYFSGYDGTIRWDDPEVAISWPVINPILSEKDKNAPSLKELIL